jgi:transposase
VFPFCSRWVVRNHFKHSIELVDHEGDIVDVLAAVGDFLLARTTYEAARQRWPKERIRLCQEARIVEDSAQR